MIKNCINKILEDRRNKKVERIRIKRLGMTSLEETIRRMNITIGFLNAEISFYARENIYGSFTNSKLEAQQHILDLKNMARISSKLYAKNISLLKNQILKRYISFLNTIVEKDIIHHYDPPANLINFLKNFNKNIGIENNDLPEKVRNYIKQSEDMLDNC